MKALLICCDRSISLQVLYGLAATQAEVHVVGTPGTECLGQSLHCSSYTPHAADDPEAAACTWVRDLNALIRTKQIDVVAAADGPAWRLLSRVGPHLAARAMPVPAPPELERLSNKWDFHTLCTTLGVAVPRAICVETKCQLDPWRLGRQLGYPLVVKPVDQANSAGVVVAKSRAELRRLVLDNPAYQFGALMAQEFVPGIDIGCSVLASGGDLLLAAVQRREGRAVLFTECNTLLAACRRLIELSGYHGIAHFEARFNPATGEVKLIECNPCFWGSLDAARQCGLNFVAAALNVALGRPVERRLSLQGAYLSPVALGETVVRARLASPGLTKASFLGLAQALSDPLPFVAVEHHAWRRRRAERARPLAGRPAVRHYSRVAYGARLSLSR